MRTINFTLKILFCAACIYLYGQWVGKYAVAQYVQEHDCVQKHDSGF